MHAMLRGKHVDPWNCATKKKISPLNPRKETGKVERKGNEEKGVLSKK